MMAAVTELIVATITSFIVPHFIIRAYGSDVNGLLSSITQFLSYIALIESGIGAIGRASFYKPLADHDTRVLSGNARALEYFYRKVSYIFLLYVMILSTLFPLLVHQDFEWLYTAALIVILSFSMFIQYYFGITHQTIIQADQRKYIPSLLQAFTLLLNMVITIAMIKIGATIHAVKIGSAAAYAIRPMVLYFYVQRHYHLDRKAKPKNEILRQRWDGLAQHIAFVIHKNTDIAVLTILANVKEVSVYSVYMLAVSGCSKVVNIFSSNLEPAFGNMLAKGEYKALKDKMKLCSCLTIQIAVILFSTASIMVSPFIMLYTKGVTDANYLRPAFGLIMLIAESFYCIRLPYQAAVYAAGHFKQTRNGALIEAGMNLSISVVLVFYFGLIGVAIGTLLSMAFRTAQYIWYYHMNLIKEKEGLKYEAYRIFVSAVEIGLIVLFSSMIPELSSAGYLSWAFSSFLVAIGCSLIAVIISLIFYRRECRELFAFMKHLLMRT